MLFILIYPIVVLYQSTSQNEKLPNLVLFTLFIVSPPVYYETGDIDNNVNNKNPTKQLNLAKKLRYGQFVIDFFSSD